MKLIDSLRVDDSVLAVSNVVETIAEYDPDTLYLAGDEVRLEETHTVYESLTGTDAGAVTITIAEPGVVMLAGHGLAAGTPVLLHTDGDLPTGLSADTVYYVLDPAADTFKLAASPGGTAIDTSGSQSGTHTLIVRPNRGYPLDDAAHWLERGATNRWAMFDDVVGTVTQAPSAIQVHLVATTRIDGLALFNLDADEVQVTVTDPDEGVVYDQTFSLTSASNVSDFYDYFFAPVLRRTDLFIEGLPPYLGATVVVTISRASGLAKCGKLDVGTVRELGATVYGFSFGIIDYSRKEADPDFGTVELVERAYRSTGSFEVQVDRTLVDEVRNILTARRARPTSFIGTGNFASAQFYGFVRDWQEKVANYRFADLSIELESLT